MRKELRDIRDNITDYDIRIWGEDVIIHDHKKIFCALSMYEDELCHFGLQTNLDDSREEKVLKLCLEVAHSLKELDKYLKGE